MSDLAKIYSDKETIATSALKSANWCENDKHDKYELYPDFNEWLNSDEGLDIRKKYSIEKLSTPSKGFFAGDSEGYNQAFIEYRDERIQECLGAEYIINTLGNNRWYERNVIRFEQLANCIIDGSIVPFIGAGLSVECGFPTWKNHLIEQGKTCGLNNDHVLELLNNGYYETVIEEIEAKGYRDAFIQEIKDAFSKIGKITPTILRLSELFTDTLITTNYDHILQQAYDTGEASNIQLLDSSNILDKPEIDKTTIIKLHGDIKQPGRCIISNNQYNEAYGNGNLDLTKPIPKVLSYHYRTSSLLFLGCSLNRDRTMEVFQAVKDEMGDTDRPQHFSLESMPETEEELTKRNGYLLNFGITPIWFPKDSYEYIEQILRLARNEMRYRGCLPNTKEKNCDKVVVVLEEKRNSILDGALNFFTKLIPRKSNSIK